MNRTGIDLQAWIEMQRREIDGALDRWLPANGREPAFVWEAMRYSLMAGGKRLRPLLALAAAEAVAERGGEDIRAARDAAMPAACALELIHTYSLVHDDLPAMDNDVLRRGRPTAHVAYGEGLAILAGDGLLTEAFNLLATQPQSTIHGLAERKIATIAIVAGAAGPAGMVGGQAIDLRAASPGGITLDADQLRDMHGRKTGALIRASVLVGAAMAGAAEDVMRSAGVFGAQIGLAFQIVDDILDVEGASAELGKTAGKDAAANKPTYPSLFGLEGSRRLATDCAARARAALADGGLAGQLPGLAQWILDRRA